MKRFIILYYSKTGNSKFLAEKLSTALSSDCKEIKPVMNKLAFLFLISLMRISIPTNISKNDFAQFTDVVIIGPVWGGLLISPLRNALNKCRNAMKNIHFALTCETGDDKKYEKYGYVHILKEAERLGGGCVKNTEAFPTTLVNNDSKPWSPKLSEKIKFTDENFTEALQKRLTDFVAKIRVAAALAEIYQPGDRL